jgi:metal-responsive CopG/Arc/MetJ family transcriptional regulator
VPETDKHCIEGFVLEGDKFEFSKMFWEMKRYFGGHANTKHVE